MTSPAAVKYWEEDCFDVVVGVGVLNALGCYESYFSLTIKVLANTLVHYRGD